MAECAKINADISFDCDYPLAAGTRDRMILINFDDWLDATLTRNMTNNQIVEAITFGSGGRGYLVEGINNSNLPKHSYVQGRYMGSFMHEVNFKAFQRNPTAKEQFEKIANGRFVAIVENIFKGTNGEAAYEIYGENSGLICTLMECDPGNQDTQGAYDITLASSENSKEPHLPGTLFITDYATTKAVFDSLLV